MCCYPSFDKTCEWGNPETIADRALINMRLTYTESIDSTTNFTTYGTNEKKTKTPIAFTMITMELGVCRLIVISMGNRYHHNSHNFQRRLPEK
jgi:hypothetical protein